MGKGVDAIAAYVDQKMRGIRAEREAADIELQSAAAAARTSSSHAREAAIEMQKLKLEQ